MRIAGIGARLVARARRTPAERDRIHPDDAGLYNRCARHLVWVAGAFILALLVAGLALELPGYVRYLAAGLPGVHDPSWFAVGCLLAAGIAALPLAWFERHLIRTLFRSRTGRDPRMEILRK